MCGQRQTFSPPSITFCNKTRLENHLETENEEIQDRSGPCERWGKKTRRRFQSTRFEGVLMKKLERAVTKIGVRSSFREERTVAAFETGLEHLARKRANSRGSAARESMDANAQAMQYQRGRTKQRNQIETLKTRHCRHCNPASFSIWKVMLEPCKAITIVERV